MRLLLRRLRSSEIAKILSVPSLNSACLYLLFPLHPAVSVPTLLAAAGSLAAWFAFTPSRGRLRGASIALFVVGLIWAVVSPYFVLGGMLYFYRAESLDPRRSLILRLGDSTTAGHLVYLTDPIRTSGPVRRLAMLLGSRAEFIEKLSAHDQSAVIMPLSSAIRHRLLGPGTPTYAEELIASYTGAQLAIDIQPMPKQTGSRFICGVGVQASNFPLVRYVRNVNNSPELPWSAVVYEKGDEQRAATYAAKLDFAIEAASLGDFQSSIGTLESAHADAPTTLEEARLFAILGSVSSAVIGGNVGTTQGLSFFNQAMRHWPRAASRGRLSRSLLDGPVDRWLFDALRMAFLGHEQEYPNWCSILGNSPTFKLKEYSASGDVSRLSWFDSFPDTPEESLIAAEHQRLRSSVERSAGNPQELAAELRAFVSGRPNVARWAFVSLLGAAAEEAASAYGGHLRIAGPLVSPWIEALDTITAMCAEPWKSRYRRLLVFFNAQAATAAAVEQRDHEQVMQMVPVWLDSFAEFGFSMTSRRLAEQMLGTGAPASQTEGVLAPMSPAAPWWDRRYLDWFGSVVVGTVLVPETCNKPGPRCAETLNKLAGCCDRDQEGKGRLFAPGLSLVLALSQGLHQPISGNWMSAYRDATGSEGVVWIEPAMAAGSVGSRSSTTGPQKPQ